MTEDSVSRRRRHRPEEAERAILAAARSFLESNPFREMTVEEDGRVRIRVAFVHQSGRKETRSYDGGGDTLVFAGDAFARRDAACDG